MYQLTKDDRLRQEAVYAALRIADLNKEEHQATAAQVVEDARTVHAFLTEGETRPSTSS